MLDHKDYVVDYCENRQEKFGHIEAVLQADAAAGQGKGSSHQVEDDVENGPAFGRFTFPVPVHCRAVLDKADHELAVS